MEQQGKRRRLVSKSEPGAAPAMRDAEPSLRTSGCNAPRSPPQAGPSCASSSRPLPPRSADSGHPSSSSAPRDAAMMRGASHVGSASVAAKAEWRTMARSTSWTSDRLAHVRPLGGYLSCPGKLGSNQPKQPGGPLALGWHCTRTALVLPSAALQWYCDGPDLVLFWYSAITVMVVCLPGLCWHPTSTVARPSGYCTGTLLLLCWCFTATALADLVRCWSKYSSTMTPWDYTGTEVVLYNCSSGAVLTLHLGCAAIVSEDARGTVVALHWYCVAGLVVLYWNCAGTRPPLLPDVPKRSGGWRWTS